MAISLMAYSMQCCLWKRKQIQTKTHRQRCGQRRGLVAVIEMCVSQVSFEAWLLYFGESLDVSLRAVVLSTLEQSVQLIQMEATRRSKGDDRKVTVESSAPREPVKPPERKVLSFAPRKRSLEPNQTDLPVDAGQSPIKPPERKVLTFAPRKKALPPKKGELSATKPSDGSR